jgi:succinyl-CoA synthetase beta subunit
MKLHEYQARRILADAGIPVTRGEVANTPEQAEAVTRTFGTKTVVKAQVHAGGRGKAGGVRLAYSPEAASEHARAIIGMTIKGRTVRKVLVAEAVAIAQEFYLGAVLDPAACGVTLMVSRAGGVDIEETSVASPESVARVAVDPLVGLADYQSRDLALCTGVTGEQIRAFASVARTLLKMFVANDCSLLEINPLVVTETGELVALDVKMTVDDNALWRHPDLAALRDLAEEEPAETEAREIGLNYVSLDGTIGCIGNGAGLAMATMDAIKLCGGEPANFLDIGGGASAASVAAALRLVLSGADIRAVLVNIFGGITRCDQVAIGLLEGIREVKPDCPLVVRLVGTNEEEGRRILKEVSREAAMQIHTASTMQQAAQMAVRLAAEVSAPGAVRPVAPGR